MKAILVVVGLVVLFGVLVIAAEMRKPNPASGLKELSGFFGGGTNPAFVVKEFIKLVESGKDPCALSGYQQIASAGRDHSFQSAEEFAATSGLVSDFYIIVLCDQSAWPWREPGQDEVVLAAFSSVLKDEMAVYTNHNRWFVIHKSRLNGATTRREVGIRDDLWVSSRGFHVLRQDE